MEKDKIIALCWKKYRKETTISWDTLAQKCGFKTGEALRSFFKRNRNSNKIEYKIITKQPEDIAKEMNDDKPILVVSDIHLPFAMEGWLEFLKYTHEKYGCRDTIVINGDLLDMHAYSFHTSETDAYSGVEEYEKAKSMIKKLYEVFPNAVWVMGNHDLLIVRRIKELGIDQRFVKTFHEMFDLPKTWNIVDSIIIDNVFYKHIGCCGGKTGHINSAVSNRMSTVSSHLHADGGIGYSTSPSGDTIFGLNSGALVDEKSYAFRYGKDSRFKATLGCGVVVSDKEAHFIPFIK